MKTIFALYSTYSRQWGPDDCGPASLSMLLKYTGRYPDAEQILATSPSPPGGLSLLELQGLLSGYGITSRCVRMELMTLRTIKTPCILHTLNTNGDFHFVVCYYTRRSGGNWKYLIGDPATGISWYNEKDLIDIWRSGAALLPDDLPFRFPRPCDLLRNKFLRSAPLYRLLFFSVPILNICSVLFGIALSWLLQRGINSSLSDQKTSLLLAVTILLALIMFAKGLSSYVKQQMLIKLNAAVRLRYIRQFLSISQSRQLKEQTAKKWFREIQLIQNAYSALFGVLFSDGALLIIVLTGLCYFEPVVGLINVVFVLWAAWRGVINTRSVIRQQHTLEDSAIANETNILQILSQSTSSPIQLDAQMAEQQRYIAAARSFATTVNGNTLYYECLGTISVVAVLSCCFYHIRSNMISYNMLMTEVVISYFVTVLTPRICQTFPVIAEGAQLVKKFHVKYSVHLV